MHALCEGEGGWTVDTGTTALSGATAVTAAAVDEYLSVEFIRLLLVMMIVWLF